MVSSSVQATDTAATLAAATAEREQVERDLEAAQAAFDEVEPEIGPVRIAEDALSVARVRARRATQIEADAHKAHAAAQRDEQLRRQRGAADAASPVLHRADIEAKKLLPEGVAILASWNDWCDQAQRAVNAQAAASKVEHELAAVTGERATSREFGFGPLRALLLEALANERQPALNVGMMLAVVPESNARAHAIAQAFGGTAGTPQDAAVMIETFDPLEPERRRQAEWEPVRAAAAAERKAEEERHHELAAARDWDARQRGIRDYAARTSALEAEGAAYRAQTIAEQEAVRRQDDELLARYREDGHWPMFEVSP